MHRQFRDFSPFKISTDNYAELKKLFLPMKPIQFLRSSSYTRLTQSNMAEYQQNRSPWRYLYIPISDNI
jgi:hypothetical protein